MIFLYANLEKKLTVKKLTAVRIQSEIQPSVRIKNLHKKCSITNSNDKNESFFKKKKTTKKDKLLMRMRAHLTMTFFK